MRARVRAFAPTQMAVNAAAVVAVMPGASDDASAMRGDIGAVSGVRCAGKSSFGG